MFDNKKNGMEYVGQLRISPEEPIVKIEVFNKNYFEDFKQPQSAVLENLTQKVLDKVKKEIAQPMHQECKFFCYEIPFPLSRNGFG